MSKGITSGRRTEKLRCRKGNRGSRWKKRLTSVQELKSVPEGLSYDSIDDEGKNAMNDRAFDPAKNTV
jgi:hypothetical protein